MNPDALAHPVSTACPNCGASVSGHFCHECGQETVLHPPSTREFMHEFIGHYVAVEGKLWKSLGLLLFRPGRLTLEYIKGRRVRYIQPLRLYLTLSVIFFAVVQYAGHDIDVHVGGAPKASVTDKAAPAATKAGPDKTVELIQEDKPGEIKAGKKWAQDQAAAIGSHTAAKVGAFFELPWEERWRLMKSAFYSYAPYAIFFMMPLFALYLKVLYLGSGRRYGEHLLFALHANGFAYLAFALIFAVAMLVPDIPGRGLLKLLLWLWAVFYLPTAMRTVYGGSRFVTALRWIVLMFLHLMTMILAVFGAVTFGIVH